VERSELAFSTAQTLGALANVLHDYTQDVVSKRDYFETLRIYTFSHRLKLEGGRLIPWVDENLDPFTGDWLARLIKIRKEASTAGEIITTIRPTAT